jgi:hypothetical protein
VKTVKNWLQMSKIQILEKKTNWERTLMRIYLGPRLLCRLIPRRIFSRLPMPRCPLRCAPACCVCTNAGLGLRRGTRHQPTTAAARLRQARWAAAAQLLAASATTALVGKAATATAPNLQLPRRRQFQGSHFLLMIPRTFLLPMILAKLSRIFCAFFPCCT